MASPSEICAKAMVLLGQNPIIDIDDTSVPNAVKCKAAYAITRDAMLREYAWAFAVRRVMLVADPAAPAFGYAYKFQLPADCIRVIGTDQAGVGYEIEDGFLMADVSTMGVRYVRRVEESGFFDSLFVDCLSIRIARELAPSILKDRGAKVAQMMDALYRATIPAAKLADSLESRHNEVNEVATSSWLTARRS